MRSHFAPLLGAGFDVRSLPAIPGERAKILVTRGGARITIEAPDLDGCDRMFYDVLEVVEAVASTRIEERP